MRALAVTLGVLLSLASVVFAAAAIGLFVDGAGGAGGFATFVTLVSLLCAVLLFRASPRRGAPRRRPERRPDSGFYLGDPTPSYGYAAGTPVIDDRRWGGDGGADTGTAHHGHSDGGGWGGSDAGSDGGSGGSDGGGGGSDGGGGGGGSD